MKHIVILFFALIFSQGLFAQNTVVDSTAYKSLQLDSLQTHLLYRVSEHTAPVYRLYATENMWTFLELDTTNGRIWQVQYSMDENNRYKLPLNMRNYALLSDLFEGREDEEFAGRFELVKTQNMYNFLLLDTLTGSIWQIQWSMDANKRGVVDKIVEP